MWKIKFWVRLGKVPVLGCSTQSDSDILDVLVPIAGKKSEM